MNVTMDAVRLRNKPGRRVTTRVTITDTEAMTYSLADAVELATLLHDRCSQKLQARMASPHQPRTVKVFVHDAELGTQDVIRGMLAAIKLHSNVVPLPEREHVRTIMRAALVQKYVALNLSVTA